MNVKRLSSAKVFGIGLSKSGTTSLFAALAQLGYRAGTFRHQRDLGLDEWFTGRFERDYFHSLDAVTDLPVGVFFPALDRRYPLSKYILTKRSKETWLRSVAIQFGARSQIDLFSQRTRLAAYGMSAFNSERFSLAYDNHHDGVVRYFADRPGDLLVMDVTVGDGWRKLCAFLGHDIPEVPFPHVYPGYRLPAESV